MLIYKTSLMILRNSKIVTFNNIMKMCAIGSGFKSNFKFNNYKLKHVRTYFINNNSGQDTYYNLYGEVEPLENIEDIDENVTSINCPLNLNSNDELSENLKHSASIQDVLSAISLNHENMNWIHIGQAIIILWQLKKIVYNLNGINNVRNIQLAHLPEEVQSFTIKLHNDKDFILLLNLLKQNYKKMDIESLSFTLLCLSNLGLPVDNDVQQLLIQEFQDKFKSGYFSLSSMSRYASIFSDSHSIYMLKDMIPTLYSSIASCSSAEDIKLLTICLSSINCLITNDIFKKYKEKVSEMIKNEIINSKEHKSILKILLFLNYPQWRNKNYNLMKKCILLLENHLNNFTVTELLQLYEVFYKIQEPGSILNEIQRCANVHLQKMEEELNPSYDIHIKLMCCLVCFSSSKRVQLDSFMERYINYDLSYASLMEFYKLLLITKTTNINICQKFWDKILLKLNNLDKKNIVHVCNSYMVFHKKVNRFRYEKVENFLNDFIDSKIHNGIFTIFPYRFSLMAGFSFAFAHNERNLEYFIYKINEISCQLNQFDCYNITRGLEIAAEIKNDNNSIVITVLKDIEKCVQLNENLNIENINLLLNCYGFKISFDQLIDQKIIQNVNTLMNVSSKLLKNYGTAFHVTDILLPNIIEKMCNYVAESERDILGFNVEKLISLCYYLGYHPTNEKFFETATNILIRDEKRLSALAYIQATLALCYFQKLSETIIKQIFNVEFLENIDNELANCYYKDIYPLRVRTSLMQLNRAVCLDYPETNIPWFHQNFANDLQKMSFTKNKISESVKRALLANLKHSYLLDENVFTPYGYHLDFLCDFNATKIAVLLMDSNAYTKYKINLKGEYQLKIRHLEILGYRVICIKYKNWQQLTEHEHIRYIESCIK